MFRVSDREQRVAQPAQQPDNLTFANPLSRLAAPLLPRVPGTPNTASALPQFGQNLVAGLRGARAVAARHLTIFGQSIRQGAGNAKQHITQGATNTIEKAKKAQQAAQEQLKRAGHALEDATFSKPKQVGPEFKNAKPSEIAEVVCLRQKHSWLKVESVHLVLKEYIQRIAEEHYGEALIEGEHNIHACKVQNQTKLDNHLYCHHDIYCFTVQVAENSESQTFYFRYMFNCKPKASRYYDWHTEYGVCEVCDGLPGHLTNGTIIKTINIGYSPEKEKPGCYEYYSVQSGCFKTIEVNGQEYPILCHGTLAFHYNRPRKLVPDSTSDFFETETNTYWVKSGTFTYSPDPSNQLPGCPEAYLALQQGKKTSGIIGPDHSYLLEPTEEQGSFIPVGGKGPGDREVLLVGHNIVLS